LDKILTPEQQKILDEARPPRSAGRGPGGEAKPSDAPRGKPTGKFGKPGKPGGDQGSGRPQRPLRPAEE